jgi:hypothetical protein
MASLMDSLSTIMTCAMVYLVPLGYSIAVICTYPMMHAICNFLMINQALRRFEIVAIVVVFLGIVLMLQPDI